MMNMPWQDLWCYISIPDSCFLTTLVMNTHMPSEGNMYMLVRNENSQNAKKT